MGVLEVTGQKEELEVREESGVRRESQGFEGGVTGAREEPWVPEGGVISVRTSSHSS